MTPSDRIVKVLGANHTKTIVFSPNNFDFTVDYDDEKHKVRAIYTYRGDVCYIDYDSDGDFTDVPSHIQEAIADLVERGEWVVDDTVQ
jgi:hypothetical protein